jgi:hypothetical protein
MAPTARRAEEAMAIVGETLHFRVRESAERRALRLRVRSIRSLYKVAPSQTSLYKPARSFGLSAGSSAGSRKPADRSPAMHHTIAGLAARLLLLVAVTICRIRPRGMRDSLS